jgi:hypothetical protein
MCTIKDLIECVVHKFLYIIVTIRDIGVGLRLQGFKSDLNESKHMKCRPTQAVRNTTLQYID